MPKYLVKIEVQSGGVEKYVNTLLEATNHQQAGELALQMECHGSEDQIEMVNRTCYDMNGEWAYRIYNVIEVNKEEYEVLRKFL